MTTMPDTTSGECRLRGAGDIQLESVLSLLLARPRRGKGFPRTSIFDFGCGHGSLLEGLRTFPPHMLRRISYFGYDSDQSAVVATRQVAERKSELSPKIKPLAFVLERCQIGTPADFSRQRVTRPFHLINAVNSVHHLHPWKDVPRLCPILFNATAVGGYLVFHDFFLGDYRDELDFSIYGCADAVYYGPAELSTIFYSVAVEAATFRFFPRLDKKTGKAWFGFTFALKTYDMEVGVESGDFVVGTYYALLQMAKRAKDASRRSRSDWYSGYAQRLSNMLSKMKKSFDASDLDYWGMYRRKLPAFDQLYFQNDPYWK